MGWRERLASASESASSDEVPRPGQQPKQEVIIPFPEEIKKTTVVKSGGGIILDAIPRIKQMNRLREEAKMAKPVSGTVISEQLPLLEHDESGDAWVKFQRPKRWEEEQIDAMQAQSELIWSSDARGEMRQRDRVPLSVLESEMVCLCLVESSLPNDDEDQTLIFVPGKTCRVAKKGLGQKVREGFYKEWHNLDGVVADEVVKLLQDWHPPFSWGGDQGEA